jgi:hypothetical protein
LSSKVEYETRGRYSATACFSATPVRTRVRLIPRRSASCPGSRSSEKTEISTIAKDGIRMLFTYTVGWRVIFREYCNTGY